MPASALIEDGAGEPSLTVRTRVIAARARQTHRHGSHGSAATNAALPADAVRKLCEPDTAGRALLRAAIDRLGLSARSYVRVLRVARTIADLDASEGITSDHIGEALQYRLAP